MVGKGNHRTIFLKEMASYLSIRSKFPIQSYAHRMNQPTEEVGVPFLLPGVKEIGRKASPDLVMQAKGREIRSQLKNSRGFQYFTNILSWPQYILEEKLGWQLAETKLTSYK